MLQNRANLGIAVGELFPQTRNFTASYDRTNLSRAVANRQEHFPQSNYNQFNYGLRPVVGARLQGRFRREIESARKHPRRVGRELRRRPRHAHGRRRDRLRPVPDAAAADRLRPPDARPAARGAGPGERPLQGRPSRARSTSAGAQSDVSATEALIEADEIPAPPGDESAPASSWACPPRTCWPGADRRIRFQIAPARSRRRRSRGPMIRRRPDVRRAEQLAAAQCASRSASPPPSCIRPSRSTARSALVGSEVGQLFQGHAFRGVVGPSVTWNILQYGRLGSNILLQDAKFKEP